MQCNSIHTQYVCVSVCSITKFTALVQKCDFLIRHWGLYSCSQSAATSLLAPRAAQNGYHFSLTGCMKITSTRAVLHNIIVFTLVMKYEVTDIFTEDEEELEAQSY